MNAGDEIEVGTIVCEGTSGIPLLMDGTTTANDSYCQVPGQAIKMPAKHFHRLRTTNKQLARYWIATCRLMRIFSDNLRAAIVYTAYERCARWLLLTHDRFGRNDILLTHEYLAMMLGSGVPGLRHRSPRCNALDLFNTLTGVLRFKIGPVSKRRPVNATQLPETNSPASFVCQATSKHRRRISSYTCPLCLKSGRYRVPHALD